MRLFKNILYRFIPVIFIAVLPVILNAQTQFVSGLSWKLGDSVMVGSTEYYAKKDMVVANSTPKENQYWTVTRIITAPVIVIDYKSKYDSVVNIYTIYRTITAKQIDELNKLIDSIVLGSKPAPPEYTGPTEKKLQFTFTLPNAATVSAGVYNGETLVRTLFSNRKYNAGTFTEKFTPLTDDLDTINTVDGLTVKVLSNNVKYEWEGSVGNTSNVPVYSGKAHGGFPVAFYKIVICGRKAYFSRFESEGSASQNYFSLDSIQQKTALFTDGSAQGTTFVATDGINVYWAGGDAAAPIRKKYRRDFVFATNLLDKETVFDSGKSYTTVLQRTYKSTINMSLVDSGEISGMAVQKIWPYLFVARKKLNEVSVINKTAGALVQTISIERPEVMTVDKDESLWIVSGQTASKYVVTSTGILIPASVIKGLVQPVAIAVNNDNNIVIADAGSSQQIKTFKDGELLSTFGQEGGYYKSATVADDKFFFSHNRSAAVGVSISYETNGTWWLVDGFNFRVLHFDANNKVIERIEAVTHHYNCYVDPKVPTRLFADFLEYEIDYSKPLSQGWKFVRNWGATITDDIFNDYVSFRPIQLSNGRTYSLLLSKSKAAYEAVELTGDTLRFTGKRITDTAGATRIKNKYLNPDGNIYNMRKKISGVPLVYWKQPLMGFDSLNNPLWGTEEVIANVGVQKPTDPTIDGSIFSLKPGEYTSNKALIVFDASVLTTGYHLGGIKDNKWVFKTAPATFKEYSGPYPSDHYYDIGNNVGYGGGVATAIENSIIYGYHGEGWKGGQTNKFSHFYENGLMIGQFGATWLDSDYTAMAGNVFQNSITKVGNDYYLYHNDEGGYGVRRFKISNLSSIAIQSVAPTIINSPIDTNVIDLMANIPTDTILKSGTDGWYRTPEIDSLAKWEIRTSVKTYDRFSKPDIFIKYNMPAGNVATIKKDLPTHYGNWILEGDLNFEKTNNSMDYLDLTEKGSGGQFFEVLDTAGKIITRFSIRRSSSSTMAVEANGYLIASGLNAQMKAVFETFQHFNISSNDNLTFSYGDFKPVIVPAFDKGADRTAPKTIRFYYYTNSMQLVRYLSFKELKFRK